MITRFGEQEMAVSTHSRPKAAGGSGVNPNRPKLVSTHSRPKAAGAARAGCSGRRRFQHTAARRRLAGEVYSTAVNLEFQHTAARRRLA